MDTTLYKEFLVEEEKFLKVLERNLKDQINRLKVEELSILKLISNSDPSQYGNSSLTNHELLPDDSPMFPHDITNPNEVPITDGHSSGHVEGHVVERRTPLLPSHSNRTEMSSTEFLNRTSDDYAGYSSHSNTSPSKESKSNNVTLNREEEVSKVLKQTDESSSCSTALNNSGTPMGPTDTMTPANSNISSGGTVSSLGETMKINSMDNTLGINSRQRVVRRVGNTNHMDDTSVNAIPLNLDLIQHAPSVEPLPTNRQEFVEEVEEVDEDDDEEEQ